MAYRDREKHLEWCKEWWAKNGAERNVKRKGNRKEYYAKPEVKAYYAEYHKKRRQERRLRVLTHYSADPPSCQCCGETAIEFLSIDHINGGGTKHVKALRSQGCSELQEYLIKNNFPEGYRVLCMNCNCALGHYGYCPHKQTYSSLPKT